jgi:predicted naringenin-chalcone synthase
MRTSDSLLPSSPKERKRQSIFIAGFHSILPRFRTSQTALLNWLIEAHVRADVLNGGLPPVGGGADRKTLEALFSRYSASADQIRTRGHELADFAHHDADKMRLFGPGGSNLAQKTDFFQERANEVFERYYPPNSRAPAAIIHVTCTGYCSPSGAQRLVSIRGWGQQTEVLHAYHMGCYAAHPAIRMAMGIAATRRSVDVVHTELCSLHLDPSNHDPAQLIIQSLFADGFIKYQVMDAETAYPETASLELLGAHDEIIADSTDAMRWSTGPMTFSMALSREVPTLLASALPRFVVSLFEDAGFNWKVEKPSTVFAIHPGGPRIVDLSEKILSLHPDQVRWSRHILKEQGNMSSATLPHIWQEILQDPCVPEGTLIVSLGAGPGLTLSGMLFRKACHPQR